MDRISFTEISAGRRRPLFVAEVDASLSSPARAPFRVVLAGANEHSNTTLADEEPVRVFGEADVASRAGVGSTLHMMARSFFAGRPDGEVYVYPLGAVGNVANTVTLTFTGDAARDGFVSVRLMGRSVSARVGKGSTPAMTAAAVAGALSGDADISQFFNCSAAAAVVTLSRTKTAVAAADWLVRYSAGVTGHGIARVSNGAGVAATVDFSGLAAQEFDLLVLGDSSDAMLTAARAVVNARWDAEDGRFGYILAARSGTVSTLAALGSGANEAHETIFGFLSSGASVFESQVAAAAGGVVARSLSLDPGRPLQTLVLPGIEPASVGDPLIGSEQESLLSSGISPIVDSANAARIVRMVTSYSENSHGQPSAAFYPANVSFLLAACLRYLSGVLTTKFGRSKLADDDRALRPAANTVTPGVIRGEMLAAYAELSARGWVTASQDFAEGLIVVRNAEDPNRVDVEWPGVLVGQLNVVAVRAAFRRQV